jgi:hypothetical protein
MLRQTHVRDAVLKGPADGLDHAETNDWPPLPGQARAAACPTRTRRPESEGPSRGGPTSSSMSLVRRWTAPQRLPRGQSKTPADPMSVSRLRPCLVEFGTCGSILESEHGRAAKPSANSEIKGSWGPWFPNTNPRSGQCEGEVDTFVPVSAATGLRRGKRADSRAQQCLEPLDVGAEQREDGCLVDRLARGDAGVQVGDQGDRGVAGQARGREPPPGAPSCSAGPSPGRRSGETQRGWRSGGPQ